MGNINSANAVVSGVGQINDSLLIDRETLRKGERCCSGRAGVARKPGNARACHGRDRPAGGIDAANALVMTVGNIEIAARVNGNSGGRVDQRSSCICSITVEALYSITRDGCNDAGPEGNFADAMAAY